MISGTRTKKKLHHVYENQHRFADSPSFFEAKQNREKEKVRDTSNHQDGEQKWLKHKSVKGILTLVKSYENYFGGKNPVTIHVQTSLAITPVGYLVSWKFTTEMFEGDMSPSNDRSFHGPMFANHARILSNQSKQWPHPSKFLHECQRATNICTWFGRQ